MTAPKKPAAKNAASKKTAGTGTTKRAAAAGKVTTQPKPEQTVQGEPSSTKTEAVESSDFEDSTNRSVPEPEVETAPEDLPQAAQEDYQAGREAAERGWPVRVCPHKDGSDQRAVWLRGYHEYAHPQSHSTVVPEDGNTEGGVYGGNR